MADQWKTYEEAGALFGLSAEAMRKRARRLRWQVQPPNDTQGKTRILVPENAALRPAGPPPGIPSGDRPDDRADGLPAELRRRAEVAEAERERVEGERENLAAELITERERRARAEGEAAAYRVNFENALGRAERAEARADTLTGEVVQQRERAARAEGEAMTLRHGLENALGRAERAEARADAEARTAIEDRRQVTEAMMQVAFLQTERDTALTARDALQTTAEDAQAARQAAQAAREAAERSLAAWTAGGPLARAWRAFCGPQAPGSVLRDVGAGVAWGSGIALAIWLVLR